MNKATMFLAALGVVVYLLPHKQNEKAPPTAEYDFLLKRLTTLSSGLKKADYQIDSLKDVVTNQEEENKKLKAQNENLKQRNKDLLEKVRSQHTKITSKSDSLKQQLATNAKQAVVNEQLYALTDSLTRDVENLESEQEVQLALVTSYEAEVAILCDRASRTEIAENESFLKDVYVIGVTLWWFSIIVLYALKKCSQIKFFSKYSKKREEDSEILS